MQPVNRHYRLNRQHNTGVALFISLVLLLVLTILGVSAVQTTSLEVRMARNEHDTLLAFQAAESALRDGEAVIETLTSTVGFTDAGTTGLWSVAPLGDPNRWEIANIFESAQARNATTAVGGVAATPTFIIEHAATVLRDENAYQLDDPYSGSATDRIEVFRITAVGVGGSLISRVTLQATYGRILE
jgi:type IV pilus assembly protein PilX